MKAKHEKFLVDFILALFLFLYALSGYAQKTQDKTTNEKVTVVLLHGLARSAASMKKMQTALEKENYTVCNIDYPSTRYSIAILVTRFVLPEIKRCNGGKTSQLSFVTHSMGGIIVRYLAQEKLIAEINRVIMLSPPNRGSEVVDELGDSWLFGWINGPAGRELGTDANSLPLQLGPATFELGIITGNRSINLILSAMIVGEDDGKVSVEKSKLEGMKDFLVLPSSHPFIMKDKTAINQTIHFLNNGEFYKDNY